MGASEPRSASNLHERDRVIAAVLAIFLGTFGAHQFYLGRKAKGCLYLAFYWTGIPTLAGIVEGIRYLTLSDQAFWGRYRSNAGRPNAGKPRVLRNALIIWTVPAMLLVLMFNQTGEKSPLACMWDMAQDGCRYAGDSIIFAQILIASVFILWFVGVVTMLGVAVLAHRLQHWLCPSCGNHVHDPRRFCPRCGTAAGLGPPAGWGARPN